MTEYTKQAVMVDALRYCASSNPCSKENCPYHDKREGYECVWTMIREAADMIEALYAKTEEQQREIDEQDEEIVELKREIMYGPDEEAKDEWLRAGK